MKKTLSVVMSNYNHAKYLPETLGAIADQSFKPLEVIVIDDASTDNSVEIIQDFTERHPFIRLEQNKKNMGMFYNAKRALQLSRGDYVFTSAADDKILPGLFEKSMNLLMEYPEAGLCCSDYFTLCDKTRILSDQRLELSFSARYFSANEFFRLVYKRFNSPIGGYTSIVKRSTLISMGGYSAELEWLSDYFAHLVIGFRSGICYIPEPLAIVRLSQSSYSASRSKRWSSERKVLSKLVSLLHEPTYKDVAPFFERTAAFTVRPFRILRFALTDKKNYKYFSFRLVKHAVFSKARSILAHVTPSLLKDIFHKIINRKMPNQ